MLWVFALMLSNVCIAAIETLNRHAESPNFVRQLAYTGPLILAAQWGLFEGFRGAPAFMVAWCVFTMGNSLVRLVNVQWFVGEPLNWRTLLGVGLILAGGIAVKLGTSPSG